MSTDIKVIYNLLIKNLLRIKFYLLKIIGKNPSGSIKPLLFQANC